MKKFIYLILVVLLLLGVSVTVFAAVCPVVDEADLLTSDEEYQLIQMLAPYGNRAVQIVTVNSLEGEDVQMHTANYAESGDIGVVFLIAMQERRWCITTSPKYEGAIDGDAIDRISAACVPYLKDGSYYGAFAAFAEECAYYLEGYDPEEYIEYESENGGFGRILVCLLIGLAAGGITAGIMAGLNKSVRPQNSAANYVRSDSMRVTVSRDIYLYHHITRTPKPQNNSSSGGGGGSRSTRSGSF